MATKVIIKNDNLLLDKTEGKGMMVDLVTPTYGWKDLIGLIQPDLSNQASPNIVQFDNTNGSNVNSYAYSVGDKVNIVYHLPHDYAPGTDLFLHIHWAHNGTSISGTTNWLASYTYAKGFNQTTYINEKQENLIYDTVDIATTPRLNHMITEIQLSGVGGIGNLLDTSTIEVDGLIKVNIEQIAIPSISGAAGYSSKPMVETIDLHYQSTNAPTKQKAPDFYV